ncbi:MAG TPA: TetR/AcrR family transcriptional regulator [Candidatus Saccharimonadales bacterium]|nr:TetR/AcrR family transcriptional regulator [Candidatus Saccharimonadales bacterium]
MQQYIPRKTLTKSEIRILKGAIEHLATKGYAKTSIGELSSLLGVSKGLIHYHFPSKEILFQETIAYIYAEARRYMERQVWQTDNPWTQIQTFISLSCQYYAEQGQLIKALQEVRANFKPKQTASLAEVFSGNELSELEKVLVTGQSLGTFRTFDPAFGALTLRMCLNGAAQKTITSANPKQDASRYAAELVEVFRRAWTI